MRERCGIDRFCGRRGKKKKKKKGQNRSKNTSEGETDETGKMEEEVEKRSLCLKLDINDRLEV